MFFLSFCFLFIPSDAFGKNDTIIIIPNDIDYVIYKSNIDNIPPIGLTVISNSSKVNGTWILTDFLSTSPDQMWISRNSFIINPTVINLENKIIYSSLSIKGINNISTGSYQGELRLYYNDSLKVIPIKITIKEYVPYLQLIIIAIGAFVSFIIQLVKMGYDSRTSTLNSLERCSISITRAITENRTDSEFISGQKMFMKGKQFFDKGQYNLAKEKFEKGEQRCNVAKTIPNDQEFEFSVQPITLTKLSDIVDIAKTKSLIKLGFNNIDKFAVIISSIILIILVMQLWIQIYPQIANQGFTGLWYINSFLIGFGSQSLVGQVIEGLKSRYTF